MAEAIGGMEIEFLNGHAFRNAVHSWMAAPHAVFVVLMLRPEDRGSSRSLAELALQALPIRAGDFSGLFDDAVWVCMRDTGAASVAESLARLRESWRDAHAGDIVAGSAYYPSQESAVTNLLSSPDSGPVSTLDLLIAEDAQREDESAQVARLELEPED